MWHFVSEYLLLKADQLEIKGFGKFEAKTTDPVIDQENKIVSPPKRTFSFLQSAQQTSQDFIEFLAKKLNKSNEQILQYINDQIQKAKDLLHKGQKIELPLIGYLHSTDRNIIKLAQTATYSLEPDNFGFTNIPLPEAQPQPQKTKTKQKQPKPKPKQTAKPQKPKPKKDQKKTKTKTAKINYALWLKRAAAIAAVAAVVVLIILFYKPLIKFGQNTWQKISKKQHSEQTVVTEQQSADRTLPADIQQTDTSAQTAAVQTTPTPETTLTSTTQQQQQILDQIEIKATIPIGTQYKHYYLIVGSFSKMENAEKFRNQLINEGFTDAGILTADPTRKRVYLNAYDDLQAAFNDYQQYKLRYPDRGIWLLINEQQ